jgi:hypothetical protein
MEWHAYKVFKNGKRAKAPVKSFAYEGSNVSAIEHFEANIKKNFNEKNRGLNYILLRGDQPQERAQPIIILRGCPPSSTAIGKHRNG